MPHSVMLVVLVNRACPGINGSELWISLDSESEKQHELMLLRLPERADRRLFENPNGTVLRTFLALPGASCNAHTWNKANDHFNSHKEQYCRDTLS